MEYLPRRKIEKRLEKRLFSPINLGLGVSAAALTVCAGSLIGALMLFSPKQSIPTSTPTPQIVAYRETQEPISADTPTPIPTNTPIPPTPTATPKPEYYLTDQWTEIIPGVRMMLKDEMEIYQRVPYCDLVFKFIIRNDSSRQFILRYDASSLGKNFSLDDDIGKNYEFFVSGPYSCIPYNSNEQDYFSRVIEPGSDFQFYAYFNDGILPDAQTLKLTINELSGYGPFVFRKELSPTFTPAPKPEYYLAEQWAEITPNVRMMLEDEIELEPGSYYCKLGLGLTIRNDSSRQFILRYDASSAGENFYLVDDTGKNYEFYVSGPFLCSFNEQVYFNQIIEPGSDFQFHAYFNDIIPSSARAFTFTINNISGYGPFVFRKEL